MDFGLFAFSWGRKFVEVSVFSFSKKKKTLSKFVLVEDVNSWGKASHEYHEN